MQLLLVACGALAHTHVINAAIVKSYFPSCCVKSYGIHHCASDHPLNVFSFLTFPRDAFVYVQWNKQTEEPPALTQRVLDATGSFPEEASVKVSLAGHADSLRHALPASQKIRNLNEGNSGLPPAPASLRDVDGVSQWWAALAASYLQSLGRSPSHREKLKPSSYSSTECWGGQGRMTFSSGLRSNSLVGLVCFEEEASPSPGVPSLPSFALTCERLKSSTAW